MLNRKLPLKCQARYSAELWRYKFNRALRLSIVLGRVCVVYRPGVGVKSIHRRWMGLCGKPFQTLNLRTGVCVCLPVCERVCELVCGTCQTLNPDTAVLSASC